jgi:hypothetical protein
MQGQDLFVKLKSKLKKYIRINLMIQNTLSISANDVTSRTLVNSKG